MFRHFSPSALRTPVFLRGGHMQTLYAKYLQETAPQYRREILPDSTGQERVAYDFIDGKRSDVPLVVLFHGLEGSSRSHYAVALMKAVQERGWHGVVAHFRSCGGEPANKMYHSGDTVELAYMLGLLAKRYPNIYAVGVSLGGNVLAKYLGECGRRHEMAIPHKAAVVSAPVNLLAAAKALEHGVSRYLYPPYFLRSLLPKVQHQGKAIRTLAEFDRLYTAPLNGFADHQDYYQQCMCQPFLRDIATPTLLLNAQNDPFLPSAYLPKPEDVSSKVCLLQPKNGGHVGFVSGKGRGNLTWLPQTLLHFFDSVGGS